MLLARTSLIAAVLFAPGISRAAETAFQDNNVGGQMVGVCRMGTMVSTAAQNASFTSNANGGVLEITTLADPQTALIRAATMTIAIEGMCNQPHTLRLRSSNGGLTTDAAPAGGFVNRVDYVARVNWAGEVGNLQPQGQAGASLAVVVPTAAGAGLGLEIEILPVSQPAIAGQYEDSLTVELFGNL